MPQWEDFALVDPTFRSCVLAQLFCVRGDNSA